MMLPGSQTRVVTSHTFWSATAVEDQQDLAFRISIDHTSMGIESLAIYNMLFFVCVSVDLAESTPIRRTECTIENGFCV